MTPRAKHEFFVILLGRRDAAIKKLDEVIVSGSYQHVDDMLKVIRGLDRTISDLAVLGVVPKDIELPELLHA